MALGFYSFTDPITITAASSVPFLSFNRSDLSNTVTFTHTAAGIISLSGALLANRFDATTLNLGTIDATTINLGTASTTQSINIGTGSGVTTINLGGAGDTVNIAGTLTWVNTTNLDVTDKMIRLNKGGAASSGTSSGIEVEEDSSATGFIRTTSDRLGWRVKAPARSGSIQLSPGVSAFTGEFYTPVTANRVWKLPDATGTLALTSDLTAYAPLSGATFTGTITGTTAIFTGNVNVGSSSTSANLILNGAASNNKLVYFRTAGVNRWSAGINTNSADPFTINASDDTGTFIDTPFSIVRAAGGNISMVRPTTISNRMAIGHSNISAGTLLYLGGGISIPGVSGANQYGILMNAVPSTAATAYYAAYFEPRSATASYTIPTLMGIHIADATKGVGSTITTLTGLYIANQTQGGTNYAIYTNLGQNRFGDTVNIAKSGASVITSYLTTGASDGNFRLISSNGSGTTANSEQAWIGLAYGTTRLAGISFLRGGDADGSLQFTTNNNTVALTLATTRAAVFSGSLAVNAGDNRLGNAFNHRTYFGDDGGAHSGYIRGSGEGYLLVTGNSSGTGDKSLYLQSGYGNSNLTLGNGTATFSGPVRSETSFNSGSQGNYIGVNNYYWRIGSSFGYVDIGNGNGPENTWYLHFVTGQNKFYFNKQVDVDSAVSVYGSNTYMNSTGFFGGGIKTTGSVVAAGANACWMDAAGGGRVVTVGPNASTLAEFGIDQYSSDLSVYRRAMTIAANGALKATQLEAEANGTSGGIILRNPSGTRFRLSVNASNQLQLDAI